MRNKYIVLYILFFLFSSLILINLAESISMDEIWCFGFSRRIVEGYIPYRDYNIVTTPLFFFIGALFSNNLILFRLYGALINAAIPVLTYYYCEKNELDKQLSALITFITSMFILSQYANYNYLLLAGMMISYLLSNRFLIDMNCKDSFLFGLSLSMILLIKQNIPAILIIIFTCIIFILLLENKINLKSFVCYALGGVIPVIILLLYLLFNDSLLAFIDYTILGLNSFTNNFAYEIESLYGLLPNITITIIIIYNLINNKNDRTINYTTLIYSLASYILLFPIVNMIHSIISLVFNIFLSIPLMRNIKLKSKNIKVIIYFSYIYFLILCLAPNNKDYIRSENEIYRNILLSKDIEENIITISEYIKRQEEMGLDVAILNKYAYLYTIPANDNNGVLDLLSIGNVGTMSNEDIIQIINSKDIILTNDYYFFQDIKQVREYVFDNYSNSGTIGDMHIYIKP